MDWRIAVVMTGVMSALSQIIGKRQVANMSAFQSGLIRDVTTLTLVVGLTMVSGDLTWRGYEWVFVTLGIFEAVSIAAYFSAQREEMSATAMFSYPLTQLLIILAAGIFFQEWRYFDPRTVVGLVNTLGVVTLVVLMSLFQQNQKGKPRGSWSTKLLLSSLVVVASNLIAKWGVGTIGYSPVAYMLWEYLGVVVGGAIFVYGRGLNLRVGAREWGWGVVQGIMFGLGAIWYVGILAENPLSLASVIKRVTVIVVMVVAGLWGYGEGRRLSAWQKWMLLGSAVVFGVVVVANQ